MNGNENGDGVMLTDDNENDDNSDGMTYTFPSFVSGI